MIINNQGSVELTKKRQINQWNRIESSEIDSHKYGQLMFNSGLKQLRIEGISLWISDAGKNGYRKIP